MNRLSKQNQVIKQAWHRELWPFMDRPELFSVLETSEAFADGLATALDLGRARHFALQVARSHAEMPEQMKFAEAVALAAVVASPSSRNLYKTVESDTAGLIGRSLSSVLELLADASTAPAFPVPGFAELYDDLEPHELHFATEWRTDTVVLLARTMYEAREFSAMPILADALQDAGCDHDDVLNHCRDIYRVHVRGCWVVDLVLGTARTQTVGDGLSPGAKEHS